LAAVLLELLTRDTREANNYAEHIREDCLSMAFASAGAEELKYTYSFIYIETPLEDSAISPIICYRSFRTLSFPYFLPYYFTVLHVIELFVEADV
jgi:hypothetical protein